MPRGIKELDCFQGMKLEDLYPLMTSLFLGEKMWRLESDQSFGTKLCAQPWRIWTVAKVTRSCQDTVPTFSLII